MKCRQHQHQWKIFTVRGSSQCWGIQSPLTISLRRAVLSPTAQRVDIYKVGVLSEKTLTPTVPRRGNHEVMMRGTFANIRIRNEMVPGVEGDDAAFT